TVVLLGLSLTSATLVGVSQLRSSQEMSVSLHAQTMAQQRAWLAAEAFQGYLQEVVRSGDDWQALDQALRSQSGALELSGLEGVELSLAEYYASQPDSVDLRLHIRATSAAGSRAAA